MRLAALVLTALLTAAVAAGGSVSTAAAGEPVGTRAGDAVVLTLDSAGKRALRGLTVRPVAPASSGRAGLRLPAKTVALGGGVATVELAGALRFRAGRRSTTATALRLTASATSSTLSAKLGRSRVTLFSARGRPALDASSVALADARTALAPAAATRLKQALRLKRAPSARAVGKLTQADLDSLRTRYELEALHALRDLDVLSGTAGDPIEAEIAELRRRLSCANCGTLRDPGDRCPRCGAS